jgi:hypothetical protein
MIDRCRHTYRYRRRFGACTERWAMEWHQPCVVLVHKVCTSGNIWRIWEEMNAPVGGDQVVDEDQHLELGQLVPGARVHAVPEWQERVRPRRHLHMQRGRSTNHHRKRRLISNIRIYFQFLADIYASIDVNYVQQHINLLYLESRRVELVWILEVVRAVMDAPEERHHLPPLGDKEPYNTPRKYME